MNRAIAWFSCGITSAVAAYLAIKRFGDAVVVANIDTGSEHPDNQRFLADVEAWLGKKIIVLKSATYANVDEVFESTGFLRNRWGAKCSLELKKIVRQDFQQPGDLHIFGFHTGERRRAQRFVEANPELELEFPLIDAQLYHADCMALIREVGIEPPILYALGYAHNNCLGCVKSESPGYWNAIRRDFPDVFQRRAEQERRVGYALVRINRQPIFLDELDPSIGNMATEPQIQCGLLCQIALD